jgi:twinkle protein
MTLTDAMLRTLESRGIDVELASRLGLASTQREGGECLVLPFTREGRVVRRKYRRFEVVEGRSKWSADKGGERIAFNEDCLRDESLLGQPLIVTEGELDAIAAVQAGFARAISVPDGAPQEPVKDAADSRAYAWLADIRALLSKDRVPEVILATDGDGPGAALMQDLSVLLGRYRCKFVTYPKAPKGEQDRLGRERCKDLNEVLQFYGAKGLVETVNRAQWLRVDGVYRMGELPPLPPSVIFEPRHALLAENFKCRLGDFSVVTGTPGFGKSTFVNDLFCGIAQDNHLTVAWASFEQEPQRDHRRSLRSWFTGRREIDLLPEERGHADRWIDAQHVFLVPREDEDATLDWLLEKMEVAVSRYAARIIVIDPWNELEHDRRQSESETEYIGRAIRTLKRFAKAFHVHICVVAHPTKSAKDGDGNYRMPTLYDINGSANWYNKADLGVIVHREDELHTIIKVQKSRYHEVIGRPGEVRCHYSKDERRFIEVERVS